MGLKKQHINQNRFTFYTDWLGDGGVGRMRLNLFKEMLSCNLEIDLLVGRTTGPYVQKVDPKVRIIPLGTTNAITSLPKLCRYLRSSRPLALVSDSVRLNVGALRARWLARVGTRILTSVHLPLSRKIRLRPSSKQKKELRTIQKYFPLNHRIIAVSDGVARDMVNNLGLPEPKIQVIYNPVVTPQLNEESMGNVDHPWFSATDVPVVISVGRLDAQKDFPTLFKAFALFRKHVEARLVILGIGKERSNLQRLADQLDIREVVDLPGFMTNPYKYMAKARLFVMSSIWEGFGNVLVEAMAVGLPVVATDCHYGPREALADGRFGPLVPVGDAPALAKAMIDVYHNPLPASDLKMRASQFSAADSARQYMAAAGFNQTST